MPIVVVLLIVALVAMIAYWWTITAVIGTFTGMILVGAMAAATFVLIAYLRQRRTRH